MREQGPVRLPARVGWIWLVYAALFAASVPWYLPHGPLRLWFGLPYWVVISIAAVAAVAVFTQFVVRRCWADDEPEPQLDATDVRNER